ncbi:MAG: ABC transporter permease subunit [Dehalococcoidia bacterium]|nr:ABC transporter permease subunit [Dehalococcoidia bacterium]
MPAAGPGWRGPLAALRGADAVRLSLVGFLGLAVASWAFVLADGAGGFGALFTGSAWAGVRRFLGELAGEGAAGAPAFLDAGQWAEAGVLASETLAMSILAITLASSGVLLTVLPAARNVAMGELVPAGRGAALWKGLYLLVRGVFVLTRGVPELVWAMIIVFFLSPGILPGALALALHNYGILGKLSAEVVEDLDTRPARSLQGAGARPFQMMAYGILPQVLPQLITYTLYRWEVVIRTTIVVGFVSAGGLGRDFRLSMSFFHYTDVALLLMWYVLLVIGVDLLSGWLRSRVRS